MDGFRIEQDPLGTYPVPATALYGIQTARALDNFAISGLRPPESLVVAQVWIKKAAALTHRESGRLDVRRADAIIAAADEVLEGQHHEHFVVDPYQAGAGTSHNMNVNEVLANRANEWLGGRRGSYDPVHPNDHVNLAQSTNDTMPTAMRLAMLRDWRVLSGVLRVHADVWRAQSVTWDHVVKAGRTHLQDAMPIRLGQEFAAYSGSVIRAHQRGVEAARYLEELGIGGSAVGTGVSVEPTYPAAMVAHLRSITGFAELREGADRVQLMQSLGDVAAFSAALRGVAVEISKIASDLRLMASGPRTGLDELRLPAVQPGSSMMPGKVNPSIPEMVNQVCLQVIGFDVTVAMAAEHGQLELNVMMPVMAFNVLMALRLLTNAVHTFTERCVTGLVANEAMCAYWVERSAALATALMPRLGYTRAAELAKRSVREGVLIRELVAREALVPPDDAAAILNLRRLTEIGVPGQGDRARGSRESAGGEG